MIVVDILPDSLYVFQITFTQAVKVWKTEDVVLHSDIQMESRSTTNSAYPIIESKEKKEEAFSFK